MGTLPRGSSTSQSPQAQASDPNIGALVQYEDDGAVILGVITAAKRDKFTILNVRGRELELARPRLYRLPAGPSAAGGTTAARVEALNEISKAIDREAAALDIQELWSFVHEENRAHSVSELCKSYFGADTAEKHAGLRNALIKEKLHFKRDKDGFEPRPANVVEELRVAEEARKRKVSIRETTVSFVERRAKDATTEIPPEIHDNFILMGEVAAGVLHSDPARQKEGKDLVHLCARILRIPENLPIERQAFEVLLKVGHFHRDTNLAFIRHEIPVRFSSEALTEAEKIPSRDALSDWPEVERRFRKDLTSRRSFTIDDISTKDMDDALSIEQTAEGYELGIHITDVSWAIAPDSALDAVARRRSTSLYCADQTVNMLPPNLSESKLSLRQDTVRACISVVAKFSQTFELLDYEVVPSLIKVSHRYTYDDVDLLLEHEDPQLMVLYQMASACEEGRIRKGAIRVHRREVVPQCDADGTIRLLEIVEESAGRSLVAEMMVLANSLMAQFASKHNIPVIYRGQEGPDANARQSLVGVPEGPAKDFTARSKLKKSVMSFEPCYHSGLGLDAYIQATSPIRRYTDLCHQRQFISFFQHSKPWIDRARFETLSMEVELHNNAANLASRETKRYWLMRYLEQRKRGEPIQGTVVRLDTKNPLVELDEVYITTFVKTSRPVRLGDTISLKISAVDPLGDYIRVEMIG